MKTLLVPFSSLPPVVQKFHNTDITCFQISPNQYLLQNDSPNSEGSFVVKINDDSLAIGFAELDDFPEGINSILEQVLYSDSEIKPGTKLDFAKFKVDADLLEEVSKNEADIVSKLIRLFDEKSPHPNELLHTITILQKVYPINTIIETLNGLTPSQIRKLINDSNPIGYYSSNFDSMTEFIDDYSDGNILPE